MTQDGSSRNQCPGHRSRAAPGVWFLVFRAPYMQAGSGILRGSQTEPSGRRWSIGGTSLPVAALAGCTEGLCFKQKVPCFHHES